MCVGEGRGDAHIQEWLPPLSRDIIADDDDEH